ncbi:MAG: hypothetical protein ACLPXW_15590, partial [Xanthobacteraceae bacterium]
AARMPRHNASGNLKTGCNVGRSPVAASEKCAPKTVMAARSGYQTSETNMPATACEFEMD